MLLPLVLGTLTAVPLLGRPLTSVPLYTLNLCGDGALDEETPGAGWDQARTAVQFCSTHLDLGTLQTGHL